jgi:hypothetical protein
MLQNSIEFDKTLITMNNERTKRIYPKLSKEESDKQWIELSQTVLNNPRIDQLFAEYIHVDHNDPIFQYRGYLQQKKTPPPELVEEIIQVDSFPHQR